MHKIFNKIFERTNNHILIPRASIFLLHIILFIMISAILFLSTCGIFIIAAIPLIFFTSWYTYEFSKLWRNYYALATFIFIVILELALSIALIYILI